MGTNQPPVVIALRLFGALVPFLCTACGGGSTQASPESTVSAFARALRSEDHHRAYELMAEGYRRRVPFEEFRRHLEEHAGEAREIAEALSVPEVTSRITASVPYGESTKLELVREDGQWKLHGNVVDFYDQSTPRAALLSFIRAMERRRYDVVMRFVPNADREGMTVERMREAWEGEGREEIERLLATLRANLENPIEVVGNRATMPYGERFTVQFLREDGVWKIEDPD